jgi:hypothetical protein
MLNGGSGETPEPTVKVWMGEGKTGIKSGGNYPF